MNSLKKQLENLGIPVVAGKVKKSDIKKALSKKHDAEIHLGSWSNSELNIIQLLPPIKVKLDNGHPEDDGFEKEMEKSIAKNYDVKKFHWQDVGLVYVELKKEIKDQDGDPIDSFDAFVEYED